MPDTTAQTTVKSLLNHWFFAVLLKWVRRLTNPGWNFEDHQMFRNNHLANHPVNVKDTTDLLDWSVFYPTGTNPNPLCEPTKSHFSSLMHLYFLVYLLLACLFTCLFILCTFIRSKAKEQLCFICLSNYYLIVCLSAE